MKKSARTILLSLIVIMSFGFASALTACQNTHSHKFTPIVGYPPTCTEAGRKIYYQCEGCDKIFADADGKNETTLQAVEVPAPGHKTVKHNAYSEGYEIVGGGEDYWKCSVCHKNFAEQTGITEVTLKEIVLPMFVDQIFYNPGTANGPDVFTGTTGGGNYDDISGQFVLRFFMGFDYELSSLTGEKVEVHMNVHRTTANPEWWQFIFIYDSSASKAEIKCEGGNIQLDGTWNSLVKKNNGLYLYFVRNGDKIVLYAENNEGIPQKIGDIQGFSEGVIYKMRIAHFENYFADETHGGVIKEMTIALGTNDLNAERSNPTKTGD